MLLSMLNRYERIDRARVLELLFDDCFNLSNCDNNEYDCLPTLGKRYQTLRNWQLCPNLLISNRDVGRSVGDGAFLNPDEESEYMENELLDKYE